LLNIAVIKEKLSVEFAELKDVYMKAYQKAKEISNIETSLKLQVIQKICYLKLFFGLVFFIHDNTNLPAESNEPIKRNSNKLFCRRFGNSEDNKFPK
jgi:hypothetical protein